MNGTESAAVAQPSRSSTVLLGRLGVMMFLQYFVQGAYLPIASVYVERSLGFNSLEIGIFSAALAVGPILAPFIFGQLVDRLFATERVVAFCHLVGGVLIWSISVQSELWPLVVLGTAYSILYVPTMMLTNSLAFQHLKNSELEFPWVRLLGTLGYIVPAYVIEFWWLQGLQGEELARARGFAFALSGMASILLGIYCLSLPHTPPQRRAERAYAPGVVVAMIGRRDLLVLVVVSFFIAMAHQFVLVWNSPFLRAILDTGGWGAYEQSISSIGQICELGVLAVLGLLIKRLGYKWTLTLGASAYLARCLLCASVFFFDPPFAGKLLLAGTAQALHGFCFGCFLAVGYMYVDRIAPPDVRGSMQTLYGTFIVSLGFFAGGLVSGKVGDWFTTVVGGATLRDWPLLWLSCAALCAGCVLLMVACFPRVRSPQPS